MLTLVIFEILRQGQSTGGSELTLSRKNQHLPSSFCIGGGGEEGVVLIEKFFTGNFKVLVQEHGFTLTILKLCK